MHSFSKIPDWVELEHQVALLLTQQEKHGWSFDSNRAEQLAYELREELRQTTESLRRQHPDVFGGTFTPKRDNRTTGYVKGATLTRLKELNPTSRDHIAWVLQNFYEWKPQSTTQSGKPVIDETTLKDVGSPIAMEFLRCLTVTKMLGLLSEGTNAWLKLSTTADRIHHHCSTAAHTHRCCHRKPNLSQVPADERFRSLFIPSAGQVMVGADLSGIELRMLAHYLARFDSGRYADILLNGDIHQTNADKIGISRRLVKTVTYAFLYGAGDLKVGLSYDPQLSDTRAKAKGKEIKQAYVEAIPGLADLLSAVQKAAGRGYVKAIDGRQIAVDSSHKALNYLLQSSAGVIAKRWMVIAQETINNVGIQANQLAFIHDELQYECNPNDANDLSTSLVLAATQSGEYYNLRIRIDAEATTGASWSDTH